mmetsp:Transcript_35586/g.70736  ORF Transcript_35586/g.70736 Transcript_35586/m.70736 type:complete len:224 (-) Transcript_35586:411-1082(-)
MPCFSATFSAKLRAPFALQRCLGSLSSKPLSNSCTSSSRSPKPEWLWMLKLARIMLRIAPLPPKVMSKAAAFAFPWHALNTTSVVGTSPKHILPKIKPTVQMVLEKPVTEPSVISGAVLTADPNEPGKLLHPNSWLASNKHMCAKPAINARPPETKMESSDMYGWTTPALSRPMTACKMSTKIGREACNGMPEGLPSNSSDAAEPASTMRKASGSPRMGSMST